MSEPLVRIRPTWWSPRVWPLLLVWAGSHAAIAAAIHVQRLGWEDVPWFWLALMSVIVAWGLLRPVVVLRPKGIEFASWTSEDARELGALWESGLVGSPRMSVAAASIRGWTREGLRIRLEIGGPPHRAAYFSIGGIRERDRERILAWLTEKVGG